MSETICDALSHSSYQNLAAGIFVQNSFSVPTQVFQECWSGLNPPPCQKMKKWADLGTLGLSWSGVTPSPPSENLGRSCHFGFELVWSTPPLGLEAGVWRLIIVSPEDTISFHHGVDNVFVSDYVILYLT